MPALKPQPGFPPRLRINTAPWKRRTKSFSTADETEIELVHEKRYNSAPVTDSNPFWFENHQESSTLAFWVPQSLWLWPFFTFRFPSRLRPRTLLEMTWPIRQSSKWLRQGWELVRSGLFYYWLLIKILLFWSGLAFLAFWYLSCCWEYFYSNFCHQPGISKLFFCFPPLELKVNETITSTYNQFTDIVSNASLMHAFPNFMNDLKWSVNDVKSQIPLPVHVLIGNELFAQLDRFFHSSTTTEHKLETFNKAMVQDVNWILIHNERIMDQLHRAETMQRKSLSDFLCCILNQPAPRLSAGTRAELEVHFRTLLSRLDARIRAGETLTAHFHNLSSSLLEAQTMLDSSASFLHGTHHTTLASRPLVHKLLSILLPAPPPPPSLATLSQISSVLAQGGRYVEATVTSYTRIQQLLSQLALDTPYPSRSRPASSAPPPSAHDIWAAYEAAHAASLRSLLLPWTRPPSWTAGLDPADLAHALAVGTRKLREEFAAWSRVRAEDSGLLMREWEEGVAGAAAGDGAGAERARFGRRRWKFNRLTRKVGQGGSREVWQREMGGVW